MTQYDVTMVKELRGATGAGVLACRQALAAHEGDMALAMAALQAEKLADSGKRDERPTPERLVVSAETGQAASLIALDCETDFVAKTPRFKAFAHQLAGLVLGDGAAGSVQSLLSANLPSGETVRHGLDMLMADLSEHIVLAYAARLQAGGAGLVHSYVHAGATSGYDAGEGRMGTLVELNVENDGVVSAETLTSIAQKLALHITYAAPTFVAAADIEDEALAILRAQFVAQAEASGKPPAILEKMVAGRMAKYIKESCLLMQPFALNETVTVAEWLAAQWEIVGTKLTVENFAHVAATE